MSQGEHVTVPVQPLFGGKKVYATVDAIDYPYVASRKWYLRKINGVEFPVSYDTPMHEIIMNRSYQLLSHINKNTLDNRRCNLYVLPINFNLKRWDPGRYGLRLSKNKKVVPLTSSDEVEDETESNASSTTNQLVRMQALDDAIKFRESSYDSFDINERPHSAPSIGKTFNSTHIPVYNSPAMIRIIDYAIFDVDDLNIIEQYTWHLKNGFATTLNGGHVVTMHELLLGIGTHIYHRNGNLLDNRRLNMVITKRGSLNGKKKTLYGMSFKSPTQTHLLTSSISSISNASLSLSITPLNRTTSTMLSRSSSIDDTDDIDIRYLKKEPIPSWLWVLDNRI